ncbi:MAG: LptF/LptG family permease [Parvularcula sp.]|jgi:lipopolysaccharide export system permease protein|nr:LptF/LptG family permease [Parvularcula sp.]
MIGTLPERYLMGRTLKGVLVLAAASLALIISIDFLEALRQVGSRPDTSVATALELTLLRSPQLLMILSPFIMLFGTLLAFAQLARSLEIAVLRAAGLSVWRVVGAPVFLAFMIGLLLIAVVDPITTRMSLSADNLLSEVRGNDTATPKAFRDGVWLRQPADDGVILIHADRFDMDEGRFDDVFVWRKNEEGRLIERYDAPAGFLKGEELVLPQALRSVPGGELATPSEDVRFATSFAMRDLSLIGTRPESLSIYTLPRLMNRIGSAGIPLEPYALRLQELFAMPLKLASMAIIACVFALPINARGGGTARLILYGIGAGFVAFILVQFSSAVAEAGLLPVMTAAWTPPTVIFLIGVSFILFREDG